MPGSSRETALRAGEAAGRSSLLLLASSPAWPLRQCYTETCRIFRKRGQADFLPLLKLVALNPLFKIGLLPSELSYSFLKPRNRPFLQLGVGLFRVWTSQWWGKATCLCRGPH